ncbi:hypothetical protein [Sorangium sp. So ce542]|uniref:hypothetical protein n=1 Tax=Sorangium sp. So ce542 TaxID=3133316 RepID=UPI003F612ACB
MSSSTMGIAPASTAGRSQRSARPAEEPGRGGTSVSEAISARASLKRPAMLFTARSSPACRTSPSRTSGSGGSNDRELLPSMRLNAMSPPCEKSTLMSSTASSGSGSRTAATSRSPSKAPSRTGASGAFMYRPKQTASVGWTALDSELPALSANERSGRRSPSKSPTTKLETLPSVGILSSLSLKSEGAAPVTPLKNVRSVASAEPVITSGTPLPVRSAITALVQRRPFAGASRSNSTRYGGDVRAFPSLTAPGSTTSSTPSPLRSPTAMGAPRPGERSEPASPAGYERSP